MKKPDKVSYKQLEVGFELPCRSYEIKPAMIADYLRAVEEDGGLYNNGNLVPPMAVAAYAINAIADSVILPPGAVHTHGEIEFLGLAKAGDTIDCYGTVSQKLERGSLHFLTMDFRILKPDGSRILKGKTNLVLSQGGD